MTDKTRSSGMDYDLSQQQAYFQSHATRERAFRAQQLQALAAAIRRRETELLAALADDLGKPVIEAYASEIGYVLRDIDHARRNLKRWKKPRRVHTPLATLPARARIVPVPLGVVLIMGPWNYPFQLVLSPLVAALAAGNCAVLKPSEFAPATARAVAELCREALPKGLVEVVQGDGAVAADLTGLPFDHIFFTGSTAVGRRVAAAAAANLTPVTLELGGKSPCIVCPDADLEVAARRIMWGKFLNAGQTCVAPDYLLVHADVRERLLPLLAKAGETFAKGGEYGRIVNRRHFDRLVALMAGTTVYAGGKSDPATLTLTPAILTDVDHSAPVMQEEIFGPLLPVVDYTDLAVELDALAERPAPLAAYLFTRDTSTIDRFTRRVQAGSICINDVISQLFPPDLPFGGVGASGQGRYHGRAGFETFSHLKSVMVRSTRFDSPRRYPPYGIELGTMKKIYRWLMR